MKSDFGGEEQLELGGVLVPGRAGAAGAARVHFCLSSISCLFSLKCLFL